MCGVQDAKKLMEDIPNKVRDMRSILVDVNLKEKDGKFYLEIVTEAYTYPITCLTLKRKLYIGAYRDSLQAFSQE